MEHRDGPALCVVFPYTRSGVVRKKVTLGEPKLTAATRRVWPTEE